LTRQVRPAQLLCGQEDRVQRRLDFVGDCRVQNLVDVAQQPVFVYGDLLRCLLNHDNFGVALLKPAQLGLNLEVAVVVTKSHSVALVWVLD